MSQIFATPIAGKTDQNRCAVECYSLITQLEGCFLFCQVNTVTASLLSPLCPSECFCVAVVCGVTPCLLSSPSLTAGHSFPHQKCSEAWV